MGVEFIALGRPCVASLVWTFGPGSGPVLAFKVTSPTVILLTLGLECSADNVPMPVHTRSGALFQSWLGEIRGVDDPGFTDNFSHSGSQRSGFDQTASNSAGSKRNCPVLGHFLHKIAANIGSFVRACYHYASMDIRIVITGPRAC